MENSIIQVIMILNLITVVAQMGVKQVKLTPVRVLIYWEVWPACMQDGDAGKCNIAAGLSPARTR